MHTVVVINTGRLLCLGASPYDGMAVSPQLQPAILINSHLPCLVGLGAGAILQDCLPSKTAMSIKHAHNSGSNSSSLSEVREAAPGT